MITLTREEANRARESAVARHLAAQADVDSWSRVIAEDAVRNAVTGYDGPTAADVSGDRLLIARAAELEAHADWQDARERWQEARS